MTTLYVLSFWIVTCIILIGESFFCPSLMVFIITLVNLMLVRILLYAIGLATALFLWR